MTKYYSKSQIVLYAKNWFMKKDVYEDIKILLADIYGVDKSNYNNTDIIENLIDIVYDCNISKDKRFFIEFINDIRPQFTFKVGYDHENYYNVEDAIVYKCLSMIKLSSNDFFPGEIAPPNYSLLESIDYDDSEFIFNHMKWIKKENWSVIEILSELSVHDKEVLVELDICGKTLQTVAMESCGEIVDVYYDEIEIKK